MISGPLSKRTGLMRRTLAPSYALLLLAFSPPYLHSEDGQKAWLRYAALDESARGQYQSLPGTVAIMGDSAVLEAASRELMRGFRGMFGRTLHEIRGQVRENSIVLGTFSNVPGLKAPSHIASDGFWLTTGRVNRFDCLVVTGSTERGVLYGVFALLSKIARLKVLTSLNEVEQPYASIRWVDQWDNFDGRIERGYAGRSIFFDHDSVRADLTRVEDYARLLASIGINGCTINNVNADPRVLEAEFLPQFARVANVFRAWGIQLSLSVDLSSPKVLGALDTFDPVDPRVADWWRQRVEEIYHAIPDFGGFVIKADSEGRLGPSVYGRTPADAANIIARALKPHGGVVFYRAFVYNHHLDWRDPKNDRAKAAYENFHPLDGKFGDNVIIQIKYGPIDFQVREPVSPLFSGLEKTNEAIELQITQEYTGQQRHLCFLVPMWKEILDFDLHAEDKSTPVKDIVSGRSFRRPAGGFVGVANVGTDLNWMGHPLAMANLYGYGRLAWNPNLTASKIAEEWTRLTFGNDAVVTRTITDMQLASWQIYESYTGPLGAGTLTDILGSHYGPGIESSERNGWGQWHRADHDAIGMDRSMATGTGYVAEYPPAVAKIFESAATTPDELLLFFHHVPYTHVLHSGKTLIQHIYDSHYEGAEGAAHLLDEWRSLEGLVDAERYAAVLSRLEYQAGHAIVWRDAICNWFERISEIPDEKRRVGNHPERVEAEAMQLQGYVQSAVTPWETASGGKAIECLPPAQSCWASFNFDRSAGSYEIDVQYFDQNNGESKFRVFVDDTQVGEWIADDNLPAAKLGGDTSTRRRIRRLVLHRGEKIRIEGIPNGGEHAALDYVEMRPDFDGRSPALPSRAVQNYP